MKLVERGTLLTRINWTAVIAGLAVGMGSDLPKEGARVGERSN